MATTIRAVQRNSADRPITSDSPLDQQIRALDELIENAPLESRVIEFSPQLAEHVLATKNLSNRPKKAGKIAKYASDLSDGMWGLTGDTVKFGSDGQLKDGQNRLAASVRSGQPLRTHAVFGIDPQLFARMDIGKNRNGADVFSIAAVKYANDTAAAVRWLLILKSDTPTNRGAAFSNEELLQAYREKFDGKRLEHSVQAALEVRRTCNQPAGPLAALHYIFSESDQQKADEFYDDWQSGRGKRIKAPAKYLQKRLVEIATQTNNRVHENVRNALIIKAWNAFVADKTVSKAEMQHAISDPLPQIAR